MSENRQIPQVDLELRSALMGLADDRPHGFMIPAHAHDAHQLIHAAQGVMTVETSDGLWVVPPERAVWVPAFTAHSIRMTGAVEMRTLYLEPEATPADRQGCFVVHVSAVLRAAILRSIEFPQPFPVDGPEARLVAVIQDEIRAAVAAPLHLPMPADPRAARLATAFQNAPSDRRTIADWSREVGASERTLERLFRAEVGMTLGAWRQKARLLRALEELAAGRSVIETALEVGFESPSAFIAMFRRTMGTTPARYFQTAGQILSPEITT